MMRSLCMVMMTVLFSVAPSHAFAADKDIDISVGVEKAAAKYQATLDKITKNGYKKVGKEKARYVSALEKDIKVRMRANDLAGANELNEYLQEFILTDPLAERFNVERKQGKTRYPLHIIRATARSHRTKEEFDVTKSVQGYVEQGHKVIKPSLFLSEETGIESWASLSLEWTYEGKRHKQSILWHSEGRLVEEEGDE